MQQRVRKLLFRQFLLERRYSTPEKIPGRSGYFLVCGSRILSFFHPFAAMNFFFCLFQIDRSADIQGTAER
jgi:hypothetical protein